MGVAGLGEKSPNLFQETRPGRFVFHDEVVPAFKRDKPSPGDPGGHSTSLFEGYGRFIAAMQHNRRDGDLRKKGVYVYVVDNLANPDRVFWRGGHPL